MTPELQAARFYVAAHEIAALAPFGSGNVNDTFLLTLTSGEERILQRVNPAVFPDPGQVMRNLRRVTEHLRHAARREKDIGHFQPPLLYPGEAGYAFFTEDGAAWRLMHRIPGQTRQAVSTVGQAWELGRVLGVFHRLLRSLNPSFLGDPLPGFHVTPRYLERYDQITSLRDRHNPDEDAFCRQFIEERRATASLLENARHRLSRQIIHGDPKVANFLFAQEGEQVISLIDLDTVHSGLLLHDLGDALRSCCNAAGETPPAPEEALFAPDLFRGWLQGYHHAAPTLLTGEDLHFLVDATALIAFELGLRFYTDHLEGDRYFKVTAPGQNLQRARTQFRLAGSIERQRDALRATVAQVAAGQNHAGEDA